MSSKQVSNGGVETRKAEGSTTLRRQSALLRPTRSCAAGGWRRHLGGPHCGGTGHRDHWPGLAEIAVPWRSTVFFHRFSICFLNFPHVSSMSIMFGTRSWPFQWAPFLARGSSPLTPSGAPARSAWASGRPAKWRCVCRTTRCASGAAGARRSTPPSTWSRPCRRTPAAFTARRRLRRSLDDLVLPQERPGERPAVIFLGLGFFAGLRHLDSDGTWGTAPRDGHRHRWRRDLLELKRRVARHLRAATSICRFIFDGFAWISCRWWPSARVSGRVLPPHSRAKPKMRGARASTRHAAPLRARCDASQL